nr:histone-lysine N-methyltransferase SETD7-like [Oryctolagus cuniculus]
MSFYNGVRITHQEVDSRDWVLNGNTLSLDEETVIDVPEPYNHVSKYCASLGHKANPSFTPNCVYDMFVHPRFGPIKCIRTCERWRLTRSSRSPTAMTTVPLARVGLKPPSGTRWS